MKQTFLCHMLMKLDDGTVAENTRLQEKPVKFILGNETLSPALESQLKGAKRGDKKTFTLQPKDAFGEHQADQVHTLDRARFAEDSVPEVGSIMAFTDPSGQEIPGMIREIHDSSISVDFNHPLAGQNITFELEVVEEML